MRKQFSHAHYTISVGINFVSQERLNLVESNQHTYDFYKWVVFVQQRHSGPLKHQFPPYFRGNSVDYI